jgi:light-regulated signal transduction histidine kinase (bacteriophytochrome)
MIPRGAEADTGTASTGERMSQESRGGLLERLQEENERLKRELEALTREHEEFLYVVSHDLKEPLRVIKSFSALILKDYSDGMSEVGKRFVGVLDEGARRLEDLLDDLLRLSRVGRKSAPAEDVDLRELLDEVEGQLAEKLAARQAELRISGPFPTVTYTRDELAFVLTELLDNALKFNHSEPPRIALTIELGPDGAEIAVQDNGIGVEPRYEEKLFRIFYRNVRREDYEGTGSGLTIAKKIVERHGGRLRLREGAEGKGSTFSFTIPRRNIH